MLSTAEHGGGEDSPAKNPAGPPSRLHNFNLKSWGKQRHFRARTTKRTEPKKEMEGGVEAQAVAEKVKEENEERRRFCVSLSKEEIEEDVYAMKGTRPARRPKKRPRAVQRQIDTLFPGGYLSEITLDTYKDLVVTM